jgi:hypothetical protein
METPGHFSVEINREFSKPSYTNEFAFNFGVMMAAIWYLTGMVVRKLKRPTGNYEQRSTKVTPSASKRWPGRPSATTHLVAAKRKAMSASPKCATLFLALPRSIN